MFYIESYGAWLWDDGLPFFKALRIYLIAFVFALIIKIGNIVNRSYIPLLKRKMACEWSGKNFHK